MLSDCILSARLVNFLQILFRYFVYFKNLNVLTVTMKSGHCEVRAKKQETWIHLSVRRLQFDFSNMLLFPQVMQFVFRHCKTKHLDDLHSVRGFTPNEYSYAPWDWHGPCKKTQQKQLINPIFQL